MSSFAGQPFRVIPQDGFYPEPEKDADGITRYRCRALIKSATALGNLRNRLAFVTLKRHRGSSAYTAHIDYGQSGTLTVPLRGGTTQSFAALLVGMTNVQGLGTMRKDEFLADLEFVIMANV
jgi:hypothetical protein